MNKFGEYGLLWILSAIIHGVVLVLFGVREVGFFIFPIFSATIGMIYIIVGQAVDDIIDSNKGKR